MPTHHCPDEQGCQLKEDADEEDGLGANPESIGDAGVTVQNRETTRGGLERNDDKESDDSVSDSDVDLDERPEPRPRSPPHVYAPKPSPISIHASSSDDEVFQTRIPQYRILPILSGVTIPLCILLDIPALLRAEHAHTLISTIPSSEPHSLFLDIGIALSMLCAALANLCLVARFLERRIKTMTILCILFLSIHDIINIITLATFRAMGNDYGYSQAFWTTFCSTITSAFTNVTLIIDLIRTPDFRRSGSGLTRRQRSLVIITIGLFSYVVFGALVNSLLVELTFVDGLYFTVVSMATIGFGDIVPTSASSRIFICVYATLGLINLVFVAGYVRETVVEGLDFGYKKRLLAIQERRRTARLRRRAEKRWKHAVVWRLQQRGAPVWIQKETDDRKSVWSVLTACFWRTERAILSAAGKGAPRSRGQRGMQLNLWALSPSQLEAAALEAGAPLSTLLPATFYDAYGRDPRRLASPPWVAVHPVYHLDERPAEFGGHGVQNASVETIASGSSGSLETKVDYREDVEDTEKKAYHARVGLCWFWLFIFWMGGAALFTATEGWTYGLAVYFCLVSFTAIGYGDVVPTTPAGRAIFVVWALVGFAIMSFFISVASEAYAVRYKGILSRSSFKHVVRRYRKRDGIESNEKARSARTSTEPELHDAPERSDAEAVDGTALGSPTLEPDSGRVRHSKRALEQIPYQIVAETRRMRQYMQLVADVETDAVLGDAVLRLLDDVMGGQRLAEGATKDVLEDAEARQALMVLGIERSVNALVDISERALAAVQERDRIITMLERADGAGRGGGRLASRSQTAPNPCACGRRGDRIEFATCR